MCQKISFNLFSLFFAGESGFAGTGDRESQYGGTYAAYFRRCAATNLHPYASGLVSAFRQQRDLPEGSQIE